MGSGTVDGSMPTPEAAFGGPQPSCMTSGTAQRLCYLGYHRAICDNVTMPPSKPYFLVAS